MPSRTYLLSTVAAATLAFAAPAMAQSWVTTPTQGTNYVAGDFHNHTTCIDGSVSVQFLLDKVLDTWNLDWFVHANHGGSGTRDCRFSDPEFDGPNSGEGKLWDQTLGQTFQGITINSIKGDFTSAKDNGATSAHQAMWRWQSIQEVDFPIVLSKSKQWKKVAIEGTELNVAGHEHSDTVIVGNQFGKNGNANAMAQYEYLFDKNDGDTSGGGGQGWTGKLTGSANNTGTLGHAKSVLGVKWMQDNYPRTSWFSPTHVERRGPFSPTANNGYNVEHFRDYNNAGPTVAFGFDGPGHHAESARGSYGPGAVGGGTYGGRGIYVAQVGGLWDAMLGEGRNFWFFGSSDFHQRGVFGPNDAFSTADFYPGEYERNYIKNVNGSTALRAQSVVDGMRTGNSYNVFGDLIANDMLYRICTDASATTCAPMGGTLVVAPGSDVFVQMIVTVPGANNSPYSFPNPILTTIGKTQPLNAPVLDHVDFIKGNVTGIIDPNDANYTNATNASATIYKTFAAGTWKVKGKQRVMTFTVKNVTAPFYIRARGTNLPAGIPNATDASGNPLSDTLMNNIPCADAACPSHLPTATINGSVQKYVDNDVEGWSNLWFYANPVYVRTTSDAKLASEKAADTLAALVLAGK